MASPLVVNLHGLGSSGEEQLTYSRFDTEADQGGFVVAAPDAPREKPRWDVGRDVAFVVALVDRISTDLCIDRARVYATGISNGAGLATQLACVAGDRFAAVALVAGAFAPRGCTTARPVPILAFHGTADPIVPFAGGRVDTLGGIPVRPVIDILTDWAVHNGCSARQRVSDVASEVRLIEWDGCLREAPVMLYVVRGGGHTWPGSAPLPRFGPTTTMIDATEIAWEFLSEYSLPA